MTVFTVEQVAQHNKEGDLWIIVHGKVYDLTQFATEHPGGKKVLVKVAGQDASKQFDQFHTPNIMENYGPKLYVGDIGTPGEAIAELHTEENEIAEQGLVEGEAFGDSIPFGDPYWYQDWYSPYYNETHRKLRAAVRVFVEKEIMPNCTFLNFMNAFKRVYNRSYMG